MKRNMLRHVNSITEISTEHLHTPKTTRNMDQAAHSKTNVYNVYRSMHKDIVQIITDQFKPTQNHET